jgi:K+-transporting ATPase KdpF subunit
MALTYVVGAVISASLLVYLLYAMLAPERLS